MATDHLNKIIEDAIIAASVLRAQGNEVLTVAVAQSIGAGIINNCDFFLSKLTENGLALSFAEGKDGRLAVRVVDA